MRFVICGVSHETHTFSPIRTTKELFERRELFVGAEIIRRLQNTRTEIGGIIDYCRREGIELVPTLVASANPSGRVTTDAFEEFIDITTNMILDEGVMTVDGMLARLHGAMVSEDKDDAEGYFLKRIREVVGKEIPVVGTFDLHANLTNEMVKHATALTGYDTYPHVDKYERGLEAAEIAHKTALGEIKPKMALSKLPFGPPLQRQVTTRLPMKKVYEKAWEMEALEKVIVVSVAPAFPWSDFAEMGFGVVVTTDDDMPMAERLGEELADWVWERREEFLYEATSVGDAVERAIDAPEGPVVLADIYDNPGGGASSDGTVLLKSLLEHDAQNVALGNLADPEAVAEAIDSGVGTNVTLKIGGKVDDLHGDTLTLTGTVKRISDGEFIHKGPMSTGLHGHLGRCVVFRVQGIDILLTENRVQPLDKEMFRINGITPEDKKIIVVKSSAHFRADYEPIAKEVIEVGSMGILTNDLSFFDFKKIPRPFYPLDKF